VIDWHHEKKSITRGRRWLDAMIIPYGIELWAGRRHLILEPFLFVKRLRRVGKVA
jgi:hypothetical protein